MESDLLGQLFSAACASGRYTERRWGERPLGIPKVADRIAQTIVKRYLAPILEEYFHPDSYGYRPGKSAIEAIGTARSDAGDTAGSLTLILKASLTVSMQVFSAGGQEAHGLQMGTFVHREMAEGASATGG